MNLKDFDRIKDFDMSEAEKFYSEENIKHLEQITRSRDFVNAVINANIIYNLGLSIPNVAMTDDSKNYSQKACSGDSSIDEINLYIASSAFIREEVNGILNNMEYFAMNFSHGTADDSVIYQSLHQSYIEIVRMLYYNIAKVNTKSHEKYYTNVIDLYNKWIEKMSNDEEKVRRLKRNIPNRGTIVNTEND